MTWPRLPELPGLSFGMVEVGPTAHPDAPEVQRLRPTAVDARRATFVAGRRAVRQALARHWGALPSDLRIEPDANGQPHARVGDRDHPTHVSISHTAGWAIAVAGDVPLGIDLVALDDVPVGLGEDVFAPREREDLERVFAQSSDPRIPRCAAFGAKEAALKWLGVGMRIPLPSVRVTSLGPLEGTDPSSIPVRILHPHGRVHLTMHTWLPTPAVLCVLLV